MVPLGGTLACVGARGVGPLSPSGAGFRRGVAQHAAVRWCARPRAGLATGRGSAEGSTSPPSAASELPAPLALSELGRAAKKVDADLSSRWLALDPVGYFLIRLDRDAGVLVLDHYTNTVDKNGVACDPDTGEPIPCAPGTSKRLPTHVWTGRTAKEVCVKVLEAEGAADVRWDAEGAELSTPASAMGASLMAGHAAYLGRELQKAEAALVHGTEYWQD